MVSIVVPVYNAEKYLEDCLISLVDQTYENIEIILVDDGSVDDSGRICDCWAEKDDRIIVYHKKNEGVSATRNFGIQRARGKFLMFVDADDMLVLNAVEYMVKEIIKDEFFLKQKSKSCTKEDLYIANELLETIQAYKEQCVGMAANMIGYLKTMMVVLDENKYLILINPVILKTSGKTYQTEEGCLSLQGVRKTQRYESIKVSYLDQDFKKKIKTFKGYTAQIIQHELDHFEGKII